MKSKKYKIYQNQTPVEILMDLRQDYKYELISAGGPSHAPNYIVSINLDGHTFQGNANIKHLAQEKAAYKLISCLYPEILPVIVATPEQRAAFAKRNKHTVLAFNFLMMLIPHNTLKTSKEKVGNADSFKASVMVGGHEFTGRATSEKLAKHMAAFAAVSSLFSINESEFAKIQVQDQKTKQDVALTSVESDNNFVNKNEVYVESDNIASTKTDILTARPDCNYKLISADGTSHVPNFPAFIDLDGYSCQSNTIIKNLALKKEAYKLISHLYPEKLPLIIASPNDKASFACSNKDTVLALDILMTLIPFSIFKTSQEKFDNAYSFKASVMVDGLEFTGRSTSEKLAKHKAAFAAISSLFSINELELNIPAAKTQVQDQITEPGIPLTNVKNNTNFVSKKYEIYQNHTPVDILMDLRPDYKYELISAGGPSHAPNYIVSINLDGHSFQGNANTKHLAQEKAAYKLISCLYPEILPVIVATPEQRAAFAKRNKHTVLAFDILMMLIPNNTLKTSKEKVGNAHSFKASVMVDGLEFTGRSTSEKLAKHKAAFAAISSLFSINETKSNMPPAKTKVQDQITKPSVAFTNVKSDGNLESKKSKVCRICTPFDILMGLKSNCKYELISASGPSQAPNFVVSATVNGHTFQGKANSKNLAQQKAAYKVISSLYPEKLPLFIAAPKERASCANSNKHTFLAFDILMMMVPRTSFKTAKEKLGNADFVKASVVVDGNEFTGRATSKKLAKHMAAFAAVSSLFSINETKSKMPPAETKIPNQETKASIAFKNVKSDSDLMSLNPDANQVQTPLDILMVLRPDCKYELISANGPSHTPNFVVSIKIDGHTFQGNATTKHLAQEKAAYNMISCFYPEKIPLIIATPEERASCANSNKHTVLASDILMKLIPRINFKTSYEKLGNADFVKASVMVDEQEFTGKATSEKLAQHMAAFAAVSSVFSISKAELNIPSAETKIPNQETKASIAITNVKSDSNLMSSNSSDANQIQTPLDILMDLRPDCKYELISANGPSHAPNFVICAKVDGHTFLGNANSKKLAQEKAAYKLISCLFPEKLPIIIATPHKKASFSYSNKQVVLATDILIKLAPRINFKTANEKLGNADIFKVSVMVDGHEFTRRSTSDKFAQYMAAFAAMTSIFNIKETNSKNEFIKPKEKVHPTISIISPDLKCDNTPLELSKLLTIPKVDKINSSADGKPFDAVSSDATASVSASHTHEFCCKTAQNALLNTVPEKKQLVVAHPAGVPEHRESGSSSNNAPNIFSAKTNSKTLKTPMEVLDMIRKGRGYEIVYSQPDGATYIASVNVECLTFSGTANSKKLAKNRAARAAISALYPDKMRLIIDDPVPKNNETLLDVSKNNKTLPDLLQDSPETKKTPLQDGLPDMKYEYIANPNNRSRLLPAFQFQGAVHSGNGTSKKDAKAEAYLLHDLHIMTQPETDKCSAVEILDPLFAKEISEIVIAKYLEVTKEFPEYSQRAVYSAILMTRSKDFSDAEILNFTIGTKCINGEFLSCQGDSLNDCHAEVICRRGLVSYFYDQLMLHAKPNTANYSIFLKNQEKGFILKPGIKFHLYVSTSCCGDARLFNPHEKQHQDDKHPNRQLWGQLRTKMESAGTVPVKTVNHVQTWDGIMVGERLLTMSCSDKIAKWNVVGVQGSLLSHFLEPIYLHSITVGSLFHPSHTKRALYGRIEDTLPELPEPFKHNKILMNTVTSQEPRIVAEPPPYSINWLIHDPVPEIIKTSTGKTVQGDKSRLCKMSLFLKYKELLSHRLPRRITSNKELKMYFDVKESSTDYMIAKQMLYKAFLDANLGSWVKKPMEQDLFELD